MIVAIGIDVDNSFGWFVGGRFAPECHCTL